MAFDYSTPNATASQAWLETTSEESGKILAKVQEVI